jgi:hypothetical protein
VDEDVHAAELPDRGRDKPSHALGGGHAVGVGSRRAMKATLLAPPLEVNADVEFCQEGRGGGRVCRYGASGPTPDLGQSPLRAPHGPPGTGRTQAWCSSPAVSAKISTEMLKS